MKYGFRSGLEERVAAALKELGEDYGYESRRLSFTEPAKKRRYSPDFILSNGIVVETKGRFVTADRQKHKLIAAEHPDLDIRFVFSNPHNRISKQSKTTYAKWCEDRGIPYAKEEIPIEWIEEPSDPDRWAALEAATEPSRKKTKT